MSLLSTPDARAVSDAIARLESRCLGEVVVACMPRSSSYGAVRCLAAGLWTVALALLAAEALPEVAIEYLLVLQLPVAASLYALLGLPFLMRPLLSHKARARRAQMGAYQTFAARGVHRTRRSCGLLIYVSELEHQVVMLGDAGLANLVKQGGYDVWVRHIVTGIRQGRLGAALIEVIEQCGDLLAQAYPLTCDENNNELPNEVVRTPN